MPKTVPNGFTLIELLVVIAIMAIVGAFTIANYRSFGEDQDLKSASLDIQSIFRTAQTNATTNLKCSGNPARVWRINFENTSGKKTAKVFCQFAGGEPGVEYDKKEYSFKENITLEKVCGGTSCTSSSCISTIPTTEWAVIRFAPVSAAISFRVFYSSGGGNSCFDNAQSMTILLRNSKTTHEKSVVIDKGGRIYE